MHDPASLCRFGTALPPIEDDEIPSKKPVYVQDQIATDEQGRRRFHGAFTGGFSAGYWNTVGSQEGWTPQSFKSSRSERFGQRVDQKPQDFMDDEDMGEFGIAPTFIKPSEDYAIGAAAAEGEGRKRKLANAAAGLGPIPGKPVLEQLLAPVKDHVGVRILKTWGWRPGQGVGPRLTRKEKRHARKLNQRQRYIMEKYGDDIGTPGNLQRNDDNASDSDSDDDDGDEDDEITFAPDDFEPYFHVLEQDKRFGLGYRGLSRDLILSEPGRMHTGLQVLDKSNKKVSISGQAFGVGAFEDEDEDIYATDDMKRYDFTLDDGPKRRTKPKKFVQEAHVLEGFVEAQSPHQVAPAYAVQVPPNFKPRNWAERKSRFTPLDPTKARELERHFEQVSMDPDKRAEMLGEEKSASKPTTDAGKTSVDKDERTRALLELITSKGSNFVRGGLITADGEEKTPQKDETQSQKSEAGAPVQGQGSSFKPFLGNDPKQQRYEQFLAADLRDDAQIRTFLNEIQPLDMTPWDREMEQKEFVQARKIYRPLGGSMSDRFVSESSIESERKPDESTAQKETKKIVMQRTTTMWKPHSLLCKRYNIPEPYGGAMVTEKGRSKKQKLSIFNYLEGSVNSKATFQTPVIIPKLIEKPQAMVSNDLAKPLEKANIPPTLAAPEQLETPVVREEKKDRNAFVPKTALEKLVVESINKPPSEKVELYRAIFEEDSDDENVVDESVDNSGASAIEPTKPVEHGTVSVTKSAAAANLLRNTSPPRGIFAALFSATGSEEAKAKPEVTVPPPKIAFKSKSERWQDERAAPESISGTPCVASAPPRDDNEEAAADAFYGPKIPEHIPRPSATANLGEEEIDERLRKIYENNKNAKRVIKYVEQMQSKQGDSSGNGSDTSSSTGSSSETSSEKVKQAKKKKSSGGNKKAKKTSKKKKKNKKHSSHGHGHTPDKGKKLKKKKDKKETHKVKHSSSKS